MKKINPQLNKLVSILNDGTFHDGDALGESLTITRAAIWKMIKKLKGYGVNVESVKGKGYRLLSPLSLLDAQKINIVCMSSNIRVACFESITSTNDYFKTLVPSAKNALDVCLAESQTMGRGRFNRTWYSPFAQNIYLSCRYLLDKELSELGGLSLVASLSIVECLQKLGYDINALVKWPNDVMCFQKKLAGILIEVKAEAHGLCEVVIGIGVNVNFSATHSSMINQSVTSLSEITGQFCNRTDLAIQLIEQLFTDLQLFERVGWSVFKKRWEAIDYLQGQQIVLLQGEKKIDGTAVGVNEQGYLLLQQPGGTIKSFSSGEVSVAKH